MPAFLLSPTVWLLIAFAALGAYAKYEGWQAERYQAERDAAVQQNSALRSQISAQNAAVDALKADGDRRVKAAADGLQAAQEAAGRAEAIAKGYRSQIAAASNQRGPGKDCHASGADMAVAKIREGLK